MIDRILEVKESLEVVLEQQGWDNLVASVQNWTVLKVQETYCILLRTSHSF